MALLPEAKAETAAVRGRFRYLTLAFAFGACMPFAFSPYDLKLVAVGALAGWLWLVLRVAAWPAGFAFGLGWFGTGAWWLAPTFHTYGPVSWVVAVAAVYLVGAALALFPAFMAWATRRMCLRSIHMLWVFPCVAVLVEWLRGWLFTGLPWTALGTLLLDTPAVGWAAYVGVYGATLLPALAAVSLALAADGATRRGALIGLTLCAMAYFAAPSPYAAAGEQYAVTLVQANVPQNVKWDAGFLRETMRRYEQWTQSAIAGADVVIWPEAAVPFFLSRAPDWDRWLNDRVTAWRIPLLFGGIKLERDSSTAYNGIFLSLPDANERLFVAKQHLVPFGEYVPAWLPFVRSLAPGIGDWQPAYDDGILSDGVRRYGSLVCYEAIFPEIARARVRAGAQTLVNVTNDAWYGQSPAAWQHLQAARMRAVETGRYVLRAANTGVTAIIAPNGAIAASTPWFNQSVVHGAFAVSDVITPYVRAGNAILVIFALPLAVMAYFTRKGAMS